MGFDRDVQDRIQARVMYLRSSHQPQTTSSQDQKLLMSARTLRLAPPTIGFPWPTHAMSNSSLACFRTASIAPSRSMLNGPRMGAPSYEAIESPVKSTPTCGTSEAMLPGVCPATPTMMRSISSEVLLMSRENGDYNVAQLRGVRLAITSETGQHRKVDEARVKLLTGGDTLPARHPYGRPFTFTPTHHTWLMSNHKPTIEGQDRGIWLRVKMIEFPNRFEIPPEWTDPKTWQSGPHIRPADPSLPAQLEAEQAGILNWLIRGAVAALSDGLHEPASVSEATERYREQMDVLGGFLDDCCEIGPYLSDTSARLYGAYKNWSTSNGVEPVASNKFGMLLAERGSFVAIKPSTGDRQRRWSGLQVKQASIDDDDR